ncbi:unnamed protein product [Lampetra fluviatilis]
MRSAGRQTSPRRTEPRVKARVLWRKGDATAGEATLAAAISRRTRSFPIPNGAGKSASRSVVGRQRRAPARQRRRVRIARPLQFVAPADEPEVVVEEEVEEEE